MAEDRRAEAASAELKISDIAKRFEDMAPSSDDQKLEFMRQTFDSLSAVFGGTSACMVMPMMFPREWIALHPSLSRLFPPVDKRITRVRQVTERPVGQ